MPEHHASFRLEGAAAMALQRPTFPSAEIGATAEGTFTG